MHELLRQQIAAHLRGREDTVPREFLEAIDLAFHQAEMDAEHLRRSMEGISRELIHRNEQLRIEVEERGRATDELVRRSRSHAFEVDMGAALTRSATLLETCWQITSTLVQHLDVGFAGLWTLDEEQGSLELRASAGGVHELDLGLASIPRGQAVIGRLVDTAEAIGLDGIGVNGASAIDPDGQEVECPASVAWLRQEGLISFAGQPLVVEGRVVGVLAVFSGRPLETFLCEALASVSGAVALAVERQRAEAELHESRERLRDIIEHASNLFYVQDADGELTYVSPQVRAFLDLEAHQVRGSWADYATDHPANASGFEANRRALEEGLRQSRYELQLVGAQGREIWVEVNEAPVVRGGVTVSVVGAFTDITERRRAEEGLRESMSMLRATLEATAEGLVVTDRDGRIVNFNRRFAEMWDFDPDLPAPGDDSVNGDDSAGDDSDGPQTLIEDRIDGLEDPDAFLALVQRLRNDPEMEYSGTLLLEDGRAFELSSKPQRLGQRSVGRVTSFRDLSEHRRLEQQMRQAQKMEAVGRLAGGIAHDFNNLLTVIKGYCSLVEMELDPRDPLAEPIDEIAKAANRAADLTGQLLAFSRQQVLEPKVLDLNGVIDDLRNMLGRVLGEDLRLVIELEAEPATVLADQGQIQQVLLNLVINARDAMPAGGTITLRTRNFEISSEHTEQFDYPVALGPYLQLQVQDTGIGMDEETRGQIFEPFFTTKEVGKGTGLGLSTVYGIIKQTGGYIWVESEPGEGTTFEICLPLVTEEPEAGGRRSGVRGERRGTETILVVEDEISVRTILSRVLSREGYRVFGASHPTEALEQYLERPKEIDLLITDILMPEMDGYELAEKLTADRSGTRVLYISGYSPEAYENRGRLRTGASFLQKPFDSANLVAKVREVLDGD